MKEALQDVSIGKQISLLYRITQSYLDKKLMHFSTGSGQFFF